MARKLQETTWRSDFYFIFATNLLSAGCSQVQFVERSFRRCALRPCSKLLAYTIFLHTLCIGGFVMSAPEGTSPHTSRSWIIAMKLKAEENSRTRFLFLMHVLENNKGIIFFEALLQEQNVLTLMSLLWIARPLCSYSWMYVIKNDDVLGWPQME